MQVDIEVVGKSNNKWSIHQSTIRIGRGLKCDVSLPVKQFPTVAPLHAELEVADGTVRVAGRDASQGELFLNDEPAQAGDVILSGDVLRLGANGPELVITYLQEAANGSGYMPTRVINVNDVPGRDVTRLMSDPGTTMEAPARNPSSAAKVAPRPAIPEPPIRPVRTAAPEPAAQPIAQPVRPGGAAGAFADQGNRWSAPSKPAAASGLPVKPAAAVVSPAAALPDPAILAKLRNLQIMQGVSLAVILLLGIWAFQLRSEVSESHNEIRALRSQDQNAVSQFTPSLDARLNGFGQRMDAMDAMFKASQQRMEQGMDAKMKAAEDQLFANLDTHMKVTEDHMVNRMNTDLPPLLDKYINAKLLEMKH